MPMHVSKTVMFTLFDEEVEVWNVLEKYAVKKQLVVWSRPDVKKVSNQRLLREIPRMAAERVAAEIGPEIVQKLASPRPYYRRRAGVSSPRTEPPAAKTRGRKPAEKAPSKTARRIHWDRPWAPSPGDAE